MLIDLTRMTLASTLLIAACTDPSTPPPEDPPPPPPVDGWTQLISGNWSLPPGTEIPNDVHEVVLDRDIYVGAIRPIAPLGTHHTVLGSDTSAAGILYASGLGTNEIVFPAGVGLKLAAGTKLSLGLHIYNTGEEPLTGTSGVEIVEVDASAVTQEADLFLPGPINFRLPPNKETTATGTCTVQEPQTLFAVFPHMHELGTHFKTTVTVGGTAQVIHDASYDFSDQSFTALDPIQLSPGDTITTECTWFNTLSQDVTFGESTDAEMCFSIMYRYPIQPGEICFL